MSPRRRSSDSYNRRRPTVEPRARVLIVCEGKKTEPFYFEGLRKKLELATFEVKVCGEGCGSAPINVVDHAIKERQKDMESGGSGYDHVWCVIDIESPEKHHTLAQALDKAKANNLGVAASNPCVEFWFYLHFENKAKPRTSAEMHKAFKKELKKKRQSYSKNSRATIDQLYPHTSTAIANAKTVKKSRGWGENLTKVNPSTHVYKVVELLREIADMPKYPKPS